MNEKSNKAVSVYINQGLWDMIEESGCRHNESRNAMINRVMDWFFTRYDEIEKGFTKDNDMLNTTCSLSPTNKKRFDALIQSKSITLERTELIRFGVLMYLFEEQYSGKNPNPYYLYDRGSQTRHCEFHGCDNICFLSATEHRCINPRHKCSLRLRKIRAGVKFDV